MAFVFGTESSMAFVFGTESSMAFVPMTYFSEFLFGTGSSRALIPMTMPYFPPISTETGFFLRPSASAVPTIFIWLQETQSLWLTLKEFCPVKIYRLALRWSRSTLPSLK